MIAVVLILAAVMAVVAVTVVMPSKVLRRGAPYQEAALSEISRALAKDGASVAVRTTDNVLLVDFRRINGQVKVVLHEALTGERETLSLPFGEPVLTRVLSDLAKRNQKSLRIYVSDTEHGGKPGAGGG